jgi:capsular exopolysaccharide synthesis family protein
MAKYYQKTGNLTSIKWKYSPRFRTKHRRGAAAKLLRPIISLRKVDPYALVIQESTNTSDDWIPKTNTTIEEKEHLYKGMPKSTIRGSFKTQPNIISTYASSCYIKARELLSKTRPSSVMQEALHKLNNNISIYRGKRNINERELFSHIQPKSAIAEAFRTMRTNISFSALKGSNKIILITSPGAEEGKSTIVANLAVVMAQAQTRVLIVDCDLRKPVMHDCFSLNKSSGLTNLLVQDLEPEEVISSTEVMRLNVIASGPIPPNPSELLGSVKMAEFLARVAQQYDIVLLDTPPVIAVTDAVLLAPMVDSVLLVLKTGETRIDMAKEARDRLRNAGTKRIGIVLNESELHDIGYYRSHYFSRVKVSPA